MHPLYGPIPTRNGVDGPAPVGGAPSNDCCTILRTQTACELACSIIDLLPSGPMWDRHKQQALDYLQDKKSVCEPVCRPERQCITMVDYAIYLAHVLADMLNRFVWSVEAERRPETSVSSIDDWLDILGWTDCQGNDCNGPYGLPEEWVETDSCGNRVACRPSLSDAQSAALAKAIAVSLLRASRGGIRNLANLNWVIEPLGVSMQPQMPWPPGVAEWLSDPAWRECCCLPNNEIRRPCFCDVARFTITVNEVSVPVLPPEAGPHDRERVSRTVVCNSTETDVYPNAMAALCIVRALMRKQCPETVTVEI